MFALSLTGRADSIVDPATKAGVFANAGSIGWFVPCDFEYGASAINNDTCGGNFEINQSSFGTTVLFPLSGQTDNVTLSGVAGSVFAYQEVDTFDQVSDQAIQQVDAVIADNAQCIPGCFGPVTFSFSPFNISGLGTTIYSQSPFDATVTAYDPAGHILGSTSYSSTENAGLLYFSDSNPTYLATVGVLDLTAVDIGSVVISTTPTTPDGVAGAFGIGTVEVAGAPEPSTFLLLGGALMAMVLLPLRYSRGSATSFGLPAGLLAAQAMSAILSPAVRRASRCGRSRGSPLPAPPPVL